MMEWSLPLTFSELRIPQRVVDAMVAHAVEDYPSECCGLLVGDANGHVVELYRIPNIETSRKRDRYTMDPLAYRRVEQDADARGLRILAVYHTHPDHPARPSETDRRRAWPDFIYIVIRVTARGVEEWTTWRLNDAHQFEPFPCRVIPDA